MNLTQINISLPFFFLLLLWSCSGSPGKDTVEKDEYPSINPDYSGIVIPFNIAPMNFRIENEGSVFVARFQAENGKITEVQSRNGNMVIPERKWKNLLELNKGGELKIEIFVRRDEGWTKYRTISNHIANEAVDPFITYRFLYPGYESWKEIYIKQRSLESFRERSIIENSLVEENCLNCHSYNNTGHTESFMIHMRGSLGATYFYNDGNFIKVNLKTDEMKNGAVYPRWHPSGKFIAFSSNKIVQQFHSALDKKVEVSDLESSLVLYDIERNEIMDLNIPDKEKYMDTYPEWSPDGNFLYFCRAAALEEVFSYDSIYYDLYRVPFDQATRKTGAPELIYNASAMGKSVSFPRISPDGYNIVITLHNYGCFPIWHSEADLVSIDLRTMKASNMALNSSATDSYHSWSSNGRWLAFSSKRTDGLTARLFFSYIDSEGNASKPFIMPQKDPGFYDRFLKSYNVPELSTLEVDVNPGKILKSARGETLQAAWIGN